MRIDGGWYLFDDGVERPIILGEALARDGNWVPTLFLVDTGADRTVLNASVCAKLGFESSDQRERLGGLGGLFAVIVDDPQRTLCLLGQRHSYTIVES